MARHVLTIRRVAVLAPLLLAVACKTFSPTPIEDVAFNDRVQTKTKGDVTVSVSVVCRDRKLGVRATSF